MAPENVGSHFVTTNPNDLRPTFTFDLATQVSIPSTATALYLEVGACLPSGSGGPSVIAFKTNGREGRVTATGACNGGGASPPPAYTQDFELVWLPTTAPHQVVALRANARLVL